MRLDLLRPLTEHEGPFASATLDVSHVDPATRDHPLVSWATQRRALARQGADDATLAALDAAVTADAPPGECTRLACACDGEVLLDVTWAGRPAAEQATWAALPHVVDVVRALDGATTHAIVRIDRTGADLVVVGASGATVERREVEGEHDELRKVSPGGMSQHRFQARAEDSWQHNAVQVAEELDRLVREVDPAVVFLEGEDHVVSHLLDHASGALAPRLVVLPTGGRAPGTSARAEQDAVATELARWRAERDAALVQRLGDARGAGNAVEGWGPVLRAAGRGQVDHVVLLDDALGAGDRVDTLVWSLASSGAQLSVVSHLDEADQRPDGAELPTTGDGGLPRPRDGVAAILRWTDDAAGS